MKVLLLFFTLTGLVFGVDVYLTVPGTTKVCLITNATNATPIRITCNSAHNMADNDYVKVANVPGNTAANGFRYVDVIDSTHFDLYSATGPTTAVAGSGAWTNGDGGGGSPPGGPQFAAVVAPYTLTDHPRLGVNPKADGNLVRMAASVGNGLLTSIVDSSNTAEATYTVDHGLSVGDKICIYSATDADLNCSSTAGSSVYKTITAVPTSKKIQWTSASVTDATYNNSDLTVSSWAQGGNKAWLGLHAQRADMDSANQYADHRKNYTLNLGWICYINRADTSACAVAKNGLLNVQVVGGSNFGCDLTPTGANGYCDSGNSDYIGSFLQDVAVLYSTNRWQLSAPERQEFADKILNDIADSCTPSDKVNLTGTLSSGASTFGTFSVTGTGTAFTTELQVGSAIVDPNGTYDSDGVRFAFVTAIADDTHLTANGTVLSGTRGYYPPWTTGKCGAIWYNKHHPGTPLGQPSQYPPSGGTSQYGVQPLSNMVIKELTAFFLLGMALADDDARARALVSDTSIYFSAYTWPEIQGWWTGFTTQGSSYSYTRGMPEITKLAYAWRTSLVSGPDLAAEPFLTQIGVTHRFILDPNPNYSVGPNSVWGWGSESSRGQFLDDQAYATSWPVGLTLAPTNTDIRKQAYWHRTVANFPAVSRAKAAVAFSQDDPQVVPLDYTTDPTQHIFRTNNRTGCLAPGTVSGICPEVGSPGVGMIISRTGWTSTSDAVVSYDFGGYVVDHATPRSGDYAINKGGKLLMGFDSATAGAAQGLTDFPKTNMFQFSGLSQNQGEYSSLYGVLLFQPSTQKIEAWAGGSSDEGRADSKYAYWKGNLLKFWLSGVTTHYREGYDLKRSGKEHLVAFYDYATVSSGRTLKYYHQYQQNGETGEGTTTAPTALTVTSTLSGGADGLDSQVLAPSGSNLHTAFEATSSWTLGVGAPAYSGGAGRTNRLTVGAGSGSFSSSATSVEYLIIHRIGSGGVNATPLNPDSTWTGFYTTDWLVMKTRGTASCQTSMTAITTVNANATGVVTGLCAGTYEYRLNGSPITGCDAIVVVDGDTSAECDDVDAGTITIALNGAAPDPISIDSTTLPAGTDGAPYSQTLSISGGTSPYTCTTASGSLPSGLSWSGDTLSGTPSGTGTASFTASCTDAVMATPDTQAFMLTINAPAIGTGPSTSGASKVTGGGILK